MDMMQDEKNETKKSGSPDPEEIFSDWLLDIFKLNANRTQPLRRGE